MLGDRDERHRMLVEQLGFGCLGHGAHIPQMLQPEIRIRSGAGGKNKAWSSDYAGGHYVCLGYGGGQKKIKHFLLPRATAAAVLGRSGSRTDQDAGSGGPFKQTKTIIILAAMVLSLISRSIRHIGSFPYRHLPIAERDGTGASQALPKGLGWGAAITESAAAEGQQAISACPVR